jgi:CheY-like chemotaxis protein
VVLLDNKMPKVNGLEVLKRMKADEYLKSIPVVALTSSRQMPDLIEFYQYGVNAYVVKPMDFSDFMETVGQLGVFWTTINEPPPVSLRKEAPIQSSQLLAPPKETVQK